MVESVSFGSNKDVILECQIQTIDAKKALQENQADMINTAYAFYIEGKETSILNRIVGDLGTEKIINQFKKIGFID